MSLKLKNGKIGIDKISRLSHNQFKRIKNENEHIFEKSDPYSKIKNTLLVVYTKIQNYPKPIYCMNGWGLLNLETMSDRTKNLLQKDYDRICKIIKDNCNSRDEVTSYIRRYGSLSGSYLTLGYKGQGDYGYNYPVWGFQSKFMNLISHA